MWRTGLVGASIAVALATSNCTRSGQPPPPLERAGVTWTVTSLPGHDPLPPGSLLDAIFKNGMLRGSDGCNVFGGPYSTTYGGGFHIGGFGGTAVGCSGPVNDLGSAYTEALGRASSFTLNGDSLTLKDAHGVTVVVYEANVPPPITGLEWQAVAYRDGPIDDKRAMVSPIPRSAITVVFGTDGTLTGSSGCNTYSATFTITGGRMEIGSPAGAGTTCSTKLMDQERAYLDALASTTSWHFSGPSFQLMNDTGTVEVAFAPA